MIAGKIVGWFNQYGQAALHWLQAIPRLYRLVLLTAAIVGIGVLLVQTTMAQRTARTAALSEATTQSALQELRQSLTDAEAGQRGFLLTLDPTYLEPYERASRQLPSQLAAVKMMFMQNTDPAIAAHVAPLDALVASKLDELSATIVAVRNGEQADPLNNINQERGQLMMGQLQGHLAALGQETRARRDRAFSAAFVAESWLVPLLLALWLTVALVIWTGYTGERERALAEAEAAQASQLRELNARNELLAKELQHRVKNLFGVALSLIGLAGRRPGTTQEVIADITARLHALSRAHDVAVGPMAGDVQLRDLLASLCAPYTQQDAERIVLSGSAVTVPARVVSPMALVVHELATNAAKYGAFSDHQGRIEISWNAPAADQPLAVEWRESGGPPPQVTEPELAQANGGFGTRMTTAAVRQIGGTIEREWPASGAVVRLTLPQR